VKELRIGDVTIPNAEVMVVTVASEVLHAGSGEESNAGPRSRVNPVQSADRCRTGRAVNDLYTAALRRESNSI
jgi:hypothetical protein